jgi:D-aminoacyl-tRNA deacylase
MPGIIYSTFDPASKNAAEHIIEEYGFKETEKYKQKFFYDGRIRIYKLESSLIEADFANDFDTDVLFFLSKHSSASGIPALTVHSMGNWGPNAKLGGQPKQLSYAAPAAMLAAISNIAKVQDTGLEKTYEATHHGPLLKLPALFVECGGTDSVVNDKKTGAKLGEIVYSSITQMLESSVSAVTKVAIGIGSNHYPAKFTALAVEKGYAFSHIMPKHAIFNEDGTDNLDMIDQALERSNQRPEVAVIEWKSVNAITREKVLRKLVEVGLEYERI